MPTSWSLLASIIGSTLQNPAQASPMQVFDTMITLISFGRFLFECLLFMLKSDSSLMFVH